MHAFTHACTHACGEREIIRIRERHLLGTELLLSVGISFRSGKPVSMVGKTKSKTKSKAFVGSYTYKGSAYGGWAAVAHDVVQAHTPMHL